MEGDGELKAPRRVHLESLARQGDEEAAAELASLPKLPRSGAHIWHYFLQLAETRQSNGMGPARLSRLEIRLWEDDEGVVLERWERRAIMAIDAAWLSYALDAAETPKEAPQ